MQRIPARYFERKTVWLTKKAVENLLEKQRKLTERYERKFTVSDVIRLILRDSGVG